MRARRAGMVRTLALLSAGLAATALAAACGSTPLVGTASGSPQAPASPAGTTGPAPAGRNCPRAWPAAFASDPVGGIQFVSREQGWAVSGNQILATSDGGRHWTVQDSGSLGLTQVDFVSTTTGWAVGTGSLLRTSDGGAHWTALADPCLRSVHFISPEAGFAIARGTASGPITTAPSNGGIVLATTDGGASWRLVSSPRNAQSICFETAGEGWLGAAGRLYRTIDGGRSWTLVTAGQAPPSSGSLATMIVQCAGAGAVWALDIGPGAAMSQEPHIGYYAGPGGAVPLFAEQYFPHPGVSVTAEAPGAYAGPISAISPSAAAFVGFCPACGAAGTVPWDLVTGTTVTREGTVGGLSQAESASFLSAQAGWVLGVVTRSNGTTVRDYLRIVATTDGGRTWRIRYAG